MRKGGKEVMRKGKRVGIESERDRENEKVEREGGEIGRKKGKQKEKEKEMRD